MKKIITLAAIGLITLVGCRKDSEQPNLNFKFSVETKEESFSDKGVNEVVPLSFTIKSEYDFGKVPFKYKIETNKQNDIYEGDRRISVGEVHALGEPKLNLSYKGKEKGEHTIKITFFNSDERSVYTKELKINYKEYGYTIEMNGKQSVAQGESTDLSLKVTPNVDTPEMEYYIIFKEYDLQDPNLEKTVLKVAGENVVFGKEYKIENLSNTKITLQPFYGGTKQLKYIIKNSTNQRELNHSINVTVNTINVDINFEKVETNNDTEILKLKGYVEKNPTYNRKIWYKTWISEGDSNGVENTKNEYKEYTLSESHEFKLDIKSLKKGIYLYFVQFKDEFGNETRAHQFTLTINDKTFSIEQTVPDISNVYQGQDVSILFNIKSNFEGAKYKIKFVSFDNQDIDLNKSYIKFNGANTKINELKDTKKKDESNSIIINSFNYGEKKLVYEIYEVTNENVKQTKEVIINFKKAPIRSNIQRKENDIYVDKKFTLQGKIEHLSRTKNIEYKTSARKRGFFRWENTNSITTTNGNWQGFTLDEYNNFSIEVEATEEGRYLYELSFKDEFGNITEQSVELNLKNSIIVDEASIFVPNNGAVCSLILKARTASEKVKMSHINFSVPEKTFFITQNGKTHSVKIGKRYYSDWEDMNLWNVTSVDDSKRISNGLLKYDFNINETDVNKANSIKLSLLREIIEKYRITMKIIATNGEYTEEIPVKGLI